MRRTLVAANLVSLACGLSAGYLFATHRSASGIYEFHSGNDGRIIWRCNRVTGEVDLCSSYRSEQQVHWRHVENGIKFVPPPLSAEEPQGKTNARKDMFDEIQPDK
jgi:hypothetical protein